VAAELDFKAKIKASAIPLAETSESVRTGSARQEHSSGEATAVARS